MIICKNKECNIKDAFSEMAEFNGKIKYYNIVKSIVSDSTISLIYKVCLFSNMENVNIGFAVLIIFRSFISKNYNNTIIVYNKENTDILYLMYIREFFIHIYEYAWIRRKSAIIGTWASNF